MPRLQKISEKKTKNEQIAPNSKFIRYFFFKLNQVFVIQMLFLRYETFLIVIQCISMMKL